jgi:hypothetical protein
MRLKLPFLLMKDPKLPSRVSKLTVKGVDYLANECDIIAPQLRQILSIDD